MTSWNTATLGSLYSIPSKNGLMAPARVRGYGVPLINMREIFAFERITDGPMELAPVPSNNPEVWMVRTDDLLFARQSLTLEGAGRCVLVQPATRERTFESHIIRVRLNPDAAHAPFYFYYFKSPAGRSNMTTIVEQVAAAGIRASDLQRLEVPVPPITQQRGIAATLGSLDDKIESNRRIVELVPRLIRALVGQALDDEARQIAVADLARFVNGGAYTKGASGIGRMVIRIAELNSGPGTSTVYSEIDVPDEKTARAGDLLMSWSGSLGVYRWVLDEAIINQHIFKVLPSDGYPPWLVFDRLAHVMPVFQNIAKDKATTMGHIQRGHLESTTVDVPNTAAIRDLDRQMGPMWERLLLAERETVALAALRDALLPELLSGRVRVPEAREAVFEADPSV